MNKIIFSALLIGKIILVSGRPLDTEESIKSLRNLVEKQGKLLDLQAREIKALEEHIQQNECQLNGKKNFTMAAHIKQTIVQSIQVFQWISFDGDFPSIWQNGNDKSHP